MNKAEAQKKIGILKIHKHRTGLGVRAILEERDNLPGTITEKKLIGLFGGERYDLTIEEYQALLSTYKKLPDKTLGSGRRLGPHYIEFTKDHRKKLKAEIKRTGCSAQKAVKYAPAHQDKPSLNTVSHLTTGRLQTVAEAELEFLFDAFAKRPTRKGAKKPKALKQKNKYRSIGQEEIETLRRYHDKTSILPGMIFKHADNPPDDLSPSMISGWLSGAITTARPEHVKWVLEQGKQLLLEALGELDTQ